MAAMCYEYANLFRMAIDSMSISASGNVTATAHTLSLYQSIYLDILRVLAHAWHIIANETNSTTEKNRGRWAKKCRTHNNKAFIIQFSKWKSHNSLHLIILSTQSIPFVECLAFCSAISLLSLSGVRFSSALFYIFSSASIIDCT